MRDRPFKPRSSAADNYPVPRRIPPHASRAPAGLSGEAIPLAALVDRFLALVPTLAPDLLQRTGARDDDPGVGVLTLGQSTAAGATERIHSRNSAPPTRA